MANKTIELASIELINFKGAKHFKLDASGSDVDVFGKNGAGKTTIYDAFTWCLFHKDSKDKEKFEWKPKDENGTEELTGTSVTLVLNVNNQTRKFTKEMNKKKMTRGNTIKKEPAYYVDDLKLKTKTAYDEKVAELIDKDTFKYLTNGNYFMESLKADERREILFKYFGSKTDEEIISLYKELSPLLPLIADRTPNETKELLQQKKSVLEKTIKETAPQIKGIRSALPDITEINEVALNKGKADLIISIDKEEQDLLALKNGSAVTEKKSEIKVKESELKIAENDYTSDQKKKTIDLEEKRNELLKDYYKVDKELTEAKREIDQVVNEIKTNEDTVMRLKTELSGFGQQFDDLSSTVYEPDKFERVTFDDHQLSCPTCKRAWDIADQEEMKENFENEQLGKEIVFNQRLLAEKEKFELDKNTKLDKLDENAGAISKKIEQINQKFVELKHGGLKSKEDTSAIEKELESIKNQGDEVKLKIAGIENSLVPFADSEECLTIKASIAQLEVEIDSLNTSIQSSVEAKSHVISGLKADVRSIDEKLATINEYNRQLQVIDDLIDKEKELSAEKGVIEAQLLLFEEFFIKKIGLLEENVNQHFNFIQFKLFGYHDNGNLNESICEPILDGIYYRDMSNGEQIKARIDICDTLMRAEGIYVPLFLDNAEGLTETFKTATQVIALNASKEDSELRINVQTNNVEEVA